jgi:uncharacterized membrane protein
MWLQQGDYNLESLYWLIGIGVIFVIALAALIIAVVALVRLSSLTTRLAEATAETAVPADHTEPPAQVLEPRTPEALRLLDGRYANGEIDRGQYLQLESDLMSTARRTTSAAGAQTEPKQTAQASPGPAAAPKDQPTAETSASADPLDSSDIGDWGV